MTRRWVWAVLLSAASATAQPLGPLALRAKIDARLRTGAAAGGPVQVYVRLLASDPDVLAALAERMLAIEIVNPDLGLVQGWTDAAELPRIAALPMVKSVRPVDRARTRAGVTSEGDVAARAHRVRAQGYDGSGVVVGVISDGIDGLAASQAAGELAAVSVPPDPRCRAGSGDEGTALLEIVHDLAPGAELLFSGAATSLEFIDAVHCLVEAGADVVMDDLGFYGEPYFKDGPVAVSARGAVQAGAVYVTAAGNDAQSHLEQTFGFTLCGDFHDFGGRCANPVVVDPFSTLDCTLQWNDPYGAAANDYDLLLVDAANDVLAAGDDRQRGAEEPIEFISWENTGAEAQALDIKIRRVSGAPRLLKLYCAGGEMDHVTPGGSIFGHAAVAEVIAVGAIEVHDPGLDDVEPFSSRGPARLYFPVVTRAKPDLAAFDGVSTAVPGFTSFFGTSAAAPHVAAAAALVLSKNPFLTPAQVSDVLRGTAVDVGPLGADDAAGAGRLDALSAADAVDRPECRFRSECGDGCPLDDCGEGTCIHSAVRGIATRACIGQPVPAAIGARFERACQLVARLPTIAKPRKAKAVRRKALIALARATRITVRAGRNQVSLECGAAIGTALANAARLVPPPPAPPP